MSLSKAVPIFRWISLFAHRAPIKWIKLIFLVLFFAVVITTLPVHLKHDSANAQGSIATIYPSANQTPDSGQTGTLAVNDILINGHGSTLTTANAFDVQSQPAKNITQTRSGRWFSFQGGPPGEFLGMKLKFDWTASGGVNASVETAGSASATINFNVSYSIDGGSNWLIALARVKTTNQSSPGSNTDSLSDGGSVEVVLSPAQNISSIQVRDFMRANATANAPVQSGALAESDAGITTSVSNIRLEVETTNCIVTVPSDRWRGEYFNNQNLSGSPAMARDDGGNFLNFNWGGESPSSTCGIVADNFSVRWTRMVNFPVAGIYRFTATVDDEARLYVDGQLKPWTQLQANTYVADVDLSAAAHEVKLEYIEYTGLASVSLSWANCVLANAPANHRWKGEYFNNQTLTGSPAVMRDEGGLPESLALNLNFGGGSPSSACNVISNNFSARWTLTTGSFSPGVYRFTTAVDNGMRLYVDGQLKRDQWANQAQNTYTTDVVLSEGYHEIKLEFVKYAGSGSVNLSWAFVGTPDCIAVVPDDRWKGEYYVNTDFTGDPGVVRDYGDNFLNFNLNQCPPCGPNPSCGLGGGVFSARYTRTVYFARGVYSFYLTADAAARVYVDGQLRIDKGVLPSDATSNLTLTSGNHHIQVEYVANGIPHNVSLSWDAICSVSVAAGRWRGEYYIGATPNGVPAMVSDDGDGPLDINFGNDSPGPCGLPADNFSARWTRRVTFTPGPYRFTVTVDDGARLYVDGDKIIDKWFTQAATTYTADVYLSAGDHDIKLEYFDGGGLASISLSWGVNCFASVPSDRWKGEYYAGGAPSGSPAMVSDNGTGFLNVNFGNDSPGSACGLGTDNFSARWTRMVTFTPGSYRFTVTVTADDGVRLYVDGQPIIDKWVPQSTTYMAPMVLSGGNHEIKLEYFDGGGAGGALLTWAPAAGLSCLPEIQLIGNAPRSGGGESVAIILTPKTTSQCGQKSPK